MVECCLWLPVAKQAFSAARSAWDCLTETLNIQQLFTHRYIINIQSVAYSCLWFKVNFLPARYLLIKNNCERCINYIGPSHNIGLENSDCDIIMAIDSIYLSGKRCFTLICVGLLIKWTSKKMFCNSGDIWRYHVWLLVLKHVSRAGDRMFINVIILSQISRRWWT